MTLGEKIASARKEKGMTQEMLAEQLGVTRQAVARWEKLCPAQPTCLCCGSCWEFRWKQRIWKRLI